ncbi:hypothetical protein BGZ58_000717 [Dissophora ornata]|nr:hypothetical protein BGZ58_000717 [Dissophora ornata]
MTLSPQLVAATIQDDPDLAKSVQDLVASHPDAAEVMTRLLNYFKSKHTDAKRPKQDQGIAQYFSKGASSSSASATMESSSTTLTTAAKTAADIGPSIYTTIPLSFLHPVRKKLVLSLCKQDIALVSPTNATEIVCSAPYESLYRVIAVPFLERTTKQTALILFFKHSGGISTSSKDAIWAVPLADDGKDFALQFHEQHKLLAGLSEDLRSSTSAVKTPIPFVSPATAATSNKRPDQLLTSILSYFLQKANPKDYPTSVDIIPNPTPAFPNFSAHLKSNQGTIYLLPTGILFAFRKPILFLRAEAMEAVGIHSVLSRTFDFEVVMRNDADVVTLEDLEGIPAENKEGKRAIGFGMVDTKEFARMEEWIKKAGIRDRSLSEDLKAKDKAPTTTSKKRERTADGSGDENESEAGQNVSSSQKDGTKSKKQREALDDDDDDDEDQDFAPESDDDIMEEYDSDAEGSDSDADVKDVASRERGKTEEDADEEDLGDEDSDEDEDEDEDDEEEDDEEEEEEEEEEEGKGEDAGSQGEDEEVDELMDD